MVVVDRKFAGAAVRTAVSGAVTPSVPGAGQTFTVLDATGYPATGKFPVVISRGNSDEEKILVASRSGAVFTVSARGHDGTSAQSHADQATCELALDAVSVNLFVDHVDDVEATPHATKLPVGTIAGHDVTARHAFGGALGTPGTPAALTPDIAGSAGAGTVPARSDHVHNVPAAVPVAVGTALAEGAGSSFARDNHVHTIGVGAINAANLFGAGVVDATALGALSVTSGKLGAASVIAGKIAAGGVSATTEVADGILSLAKLLLEDPVSYAPSFASFSDGAGGAFTGGTGATTYGYYFKAGRLVVFLTGFAFAADGNLPSGSTIRIPAPFTQRALTTMRGFVAARVRRASPEFYASGTGVIQAGNNFGENIATAGAAAQWDATVPFNWGTPGDASSVTLDSVGIMVSST